MNLRNFKKKQQEDLEEALQKVEVAKVNAVAKEKDVNLGQDMKGNQSNIDHLKTTLRKELRITGTISMTGHKLEFCCEVPYQTAVTISEIHKFIFILSDKYLCMDIASKCKPAVI